MITVDRFASFDLKLEFKVTKGANSGIKYFLDEPTLKEKKIGLGLEYQILDDLNHPDAKKGSEGNHTLASLYDLIPASADKKANAIGEWNEARLLVKGNHVEHWLNGKKVVEFERGSPEFRAAVARSKYSKTPKFGEGVDSPLLLQDHGDTVSFRNIKIKTL